MGAQITHTVETFRWNVCLVERLFGGTSVWWNVCLVERLFGGTSVWWNVCLVERLYDGCKIPLAAFMVQLGGLNKEWIIEFQYSS
jgi:hypothetical protein